MIYDAVRATRPLAILGTHAYDEFYAAVAAGPPITQAKADSIAVAAFWADPVLASAVLLRTNIEIAAHGWVCDNCPLEARPSPLRMSWAEFRPFLSAYVWPVQSESGDIDIFVCSAVSGAARLAGPISARQTGFLVAASFATDERRAREISDIKDVYNRSQDRAIDVMRQQIDIYLASSVSQRHICLALSEVAWFTGVTLGECEIAE